jgi:cytoskeletal protein RodZ
MTPARYCGTCGTLLTPEALAAGHCQVCDTPTPEPMHLTSETRSPGGSPDPSPPSEPPPRRGAAVWPASQPPRVSSGDLLRTLSLGVGGVLIALLLAALLAALLQVRFPIILAPSSSSSSNSSSNSNASSQSVSGAAATMTATTTHGATPTPTGRSPAATPTSAAPTATLSVQPTTITLSTCVAAQTQVTVANTGGEPLSWSATASVTGYSLSPASGTLNAGSQQVVTVSGILVSGTITVTAPGAQQSPQQVNVTCQV